MWFGKASTTTRLSARALRGPLGGGWRWPVAGSTFGVWAVTVVCPSAVHDNMAGDCFVGRWDQAGCCRERGPNLALYRFRGTWTPTSTPITNWTAVASSADGTRLLAMIGGVWLGSPGPAFVSIDSGATWLTCGAPVLTWTSVAASADGSRLVATGGGLVYTSGDGGTTWTAAGASVTNACYAVASSADGAHLVAVGASIYSLTDAGVTWSKATVPPEMSSNAWDSVACSSDGAPSSLAVPLSIRS